MGLGEKCSYLLHVYSQLLKACLSLPLGSACQATITQRYQPKCTQTLYDAVLLLMTSYLRRTACQSLNCCQTLPYVTAAYFQCIQGDHLWFAANALYRYATGHGLLPVQEQALPAAETALCSRELTLSVVLH